VGPKVGIKGHGKYRPIFILNKYTHTHTHIYIYNTVKNAKIFLYFLVRLCVCCLARGEGVIYILEYVTVILFEIKLINICTWHKSQKVKRR
jgi:hypothetical protein